MGKFISSQRLEGLDIFQMELLLSNRYTKDEVLKINKKQFIDKDIEEGKKHTEHIVKNYLQKCTEEDLEIDDVKYPTIQYRMPTDKPVYRYNCYNKDKFITYGDIVKKYGKFHKVNKLLKDIPAAAYIVDKKSRALKKLYKIKEVEYYIENHTIVNDTVLFYEYDKNVYLSNKDTQELYDKSRQFVMYKIKDLKPVAKYYDRKKCTYTNLYDAVEVKKKLGPINNG